MAAVILGGIPTAASTLFSHLIRASGFSGLAGAGICIGGILNIYQQRVSGTLNCTDDEIMEQIGNLIRTSAELYGSWK